MTKIQSISVKDESLWARAKEVAARRETTLSKLVEDALRRELSKLPDGDFDRIVNRY